MNPFKRYDATPETIRKAKARRSKKIELLFLGKRRTFDGCVVHWHGEPGIWFDDDGSVTMYISSK
jgi:hypothetical protein